MSVPGLVYVPAFLSDEEETEIIWHVDALPWMTDLKRRVQHYGYRYSYRDRAIDLSMKLGPLPEFALPVAERLLDAKLLPEMPDQLIINEYEPGQGIAPHVDCVPCFKDAIATVSLGWAYEIDFSRDGETRSLLLERRSVLVMSGEARWQWKHGIKPRLKDGDVPRQRRVSLTFRNVILASEAAA